VIDLEQLRSLLRFNARFFLGVVNSSITWTSSSESSDSSVDSNLWIYKYGLDSRSTNPAPRVRRQVRIAWTYRLN
jgi:hypothetical protein